MTTPMIVNGIAAVPTPLDLRIERVNAIKRGLQAKGLDDQVCMQVTKDGPCWQPLARGLEREPERQSNYGRVVRCDSCEDTRLTVRQEDKLIAAGKADAGDRVANLVRTPMAQYRVGSWVCQYGKTWYLLPPQPNSLQGGRPVHSPAHTLASGTDWYAFDCGFGDDCAREHKSRLYEEVDRGPRWPL